MRQKLVPALLLSVAIAAPIGCDKQSRLVGKWSSVGADTSVSVECLSDYSAIVTIDQAQDGEPGAPSFGDGGGELTASGTCSTLDDGRVKIAFTLFGTTGILLGTFAGDDLVLEIDGKPTRLTKANSG